MAMMGDGRTSYDNDNDGLSNKLGGCEADFRRKLVPTRGRITYNSGSKQLHVSFFLSLVGTQIMSDRSGPL
jgi:mannose-binding lectin 2